MSCTCSEAREGSRMGYTLHLLLYLYGLYHPPLPPETFILSGQVSLNSGLKLNLHLISLIESSKTALPDLVPWRNVGSSVSGISFASLRNLSSRVGTRRRKVGWKYSGSTHAFTQKPCRHDCTSTAVLQSPMKPEKKNAYIQPKRR